MSNKTITVTVIDRAAMAEAWGTSHYGVILRTVQIADRCPQCGGPRGKPRLHRQCDDGDWYNVSVWDNPCGHRDMYSDVLQEDATDAFVAAS